MQPTTSGSSGGGSGGADLNRGGLARFRSAPASWLEALLEDEEEDPLKQSQCLTQLLAGSSDTPPQTSRSSVAFPPPEDPVLFDFGSAGILRQNSSPADFVAYSDYSLNLGAPARYEYDYVSSNIDVSPAGEAVREVESRSSSAKYQSHMKIELVRQLSGSGGSLMEMEMEKLLEDSVPCRVRAKRGFATHPRSIAERVRRTKISDRIRKLQELVPNMDKQTNTADMLDEAVEYVKLLQKQIQELSEHRKKCTCVARDQGL